MFDKLNENVGKTPGLFADFLASCLTFFPDNWVLLTAPIVVIFGSLGFTPLKAKGDENIGEWIAIWSRRVSFYYGIFLFITPLPFVAIFQAISKAGILSGLTRFFWEISLQSLWLIPHAGITYGARSIYLRKIAPKLSANFKKNTISQTSDTLSDIREVGKDIKIETYDPETYYKWGSIFLGLNRERRPILITLDVFLDNHLQILGGTGWGKGVLVGCIIDQLIWQGITVFYADPKDDEFIPHIMYQRCLREGRKFTYFSFLDEEPGEWGPFLGGTLRDARTRLASSFGIGKDTGDNSAIHKSREVRMTRKALDTVRDIDGIFKFCEVEKEDSRITTELDTWRTYRSLCPEKGGLSIADSLIRGDVVYIKGALLDPVISTVTKCMMTEAVQEIIRLKKIPKRKAVWLWDEYSFYVGPEAPEALASIRSAGMVFSLIYQSDQDARNLKDKTVNGNYVYNGINKNSQLKLVYGGWDSDNAKWISQLSGTIYKDIAKTTEVEANDGGAETWSKKSMIVKEEEALIHENLIKRLPKRVCVFLQPGELPQLCFTSFVPVKDPKALPAYLSTLMTPNSKAAIAQVAQANLSQGLAATNASVATTAQTPASPSISAASEPPTAGLSGGSAPVPAQNTSSPFSSLNISSEQTQKPPRSKGKKALKNGSSKKSSAPIESPVLLEPWVPEYFDSPPPSDDERPFSEPELEVAESYQG